MKAFSLKRLTIVLLIQTLCFFAFTFFYLGKGSYSYGPSMGLPVIVWLAILIVFSFLITFLVLITGFFNFAKHLLISSILLIPIGTAIFLLPFEFYSSNFEKYRFRIKGGECSLILNLTEERKFWLNLDYSLKNTGDLLFDGKWFNVGDTIKFQDIDGRSQSFYILNQKLYKLPNHPNPIKLYHY